MSNITKIGLDNLEKRIVEQMITVPCDMTSDQLLGWANGYKQCEDNVLAIIREFRETDTVTEDALRDLFRGE